MTDLHTAVLKLSLHHPEDGFYQGTRFDRSGVWDSLTFAGTELCDRWFTAYDPRMHDAVCGPAEEFSPLFLKDGRIVKIGVGLLQADAAPYDRFKLYPVLDGGEWTVEAASDRVLFVHRLAGFYTYRKEIALVGPAAFEIRHTLFAERPLSGEVYNHNFFTLGKLAVGPSRLLDFPFCPEGSWRAAYDSVGFTPSGVRFSRALAEGESIYSGDIHLAGGAGMPYALRLSEGPLSVDISGSVPVVRTVLWANHRIACPEPYNAFSALPGAPFRWTLHYEIKDRTI